MFYRIGPWDLFFSVFTVTLWSLLWLMTLSTPTSAWPTPGPVVELLTCQVIWYKTFLSSLMQNRERVGCFPWQEGWAYIWLYKDGQSAFGEANLFCDTLWVVENIVGNCDILMKWKMNFVQTESLGPTNLCKILWAFVEVMDRSCPTFDHF